MRDSKPFRTILKEKRRLLRSRRKHRVLGIFHAVVKLTVRVFRACGESTRLERYFGKFSSGNTVVWRRYKRPRSALPGFPRRVSRWHSTVPYARNWMELEFLECGRTFSLPRARISFKYESLETVFKTETNVVEGFESFPSSLGEVLDKTNRTVENFTV